MLIQTTLSLFKNICSLTRKLTRGIFTAFALTCLTSCLQSGSLSGQDESKSELKVGLAVDPTLFTDNLVTAGLVKPTLMEVAADGRIFVSEKTGKLRIVKGNTLLPTPFVTLVVSILGEGGLMGVTLDPEYASNRYVYVYYTSTSGPRNRVSRFTASLANPDVADPGETILLEMPVLPSAIGYHNGGDIQFGADGKLYISVGDALYAAGAQLLDNPFGKMLRINKDGSIPSDNPFFTTTVGINKAIYALGFRNPFAFSIQPGTGRIFVNDVGEDTAEEIDDLVPGANYGWPASEGNFNTTGFTAPLFAYGHDQGCSITGGDFYNPVNPTFPSSMVGSYFFSDFCGAWIARLDAATGSVTPFALSRQRPTDIRTGPNGSLYYLSYGTGELRRISVTNTSAYLEAESANWSEGGFGSAGSGFTGNGYLNFQNTNQGWVEFSGTLEYASTTTLALRFANGNLTPTLVRVTLNGVTIADNVPLASTGSWSTWANVTGTLSLVPGINTLRITKVGGVGLYIDHLAVVGD